MNPQDDSPQEKKKPEEIDEGGAQRRSILQNPLRFSMPLKFRPVKTTAVLVAIILLLLFLMMYFGLGGGRGGKLGSGQSNPVHPQSPNAGQPNDPGPTAKDEEEESEENAESVTRELIVSFFPSASDPKYAQEMMCRLEWKEDQSEVPVIRNVAAQNMADFEFALEKTIRQWRNGLKQPGDLPIVTVRMTPFPGEGIYRKIETIVFAVDPKISMMRLESE